MFERKKDFCETLKEDLEEIEGDDEENCEPIIDKLAEALSHKIEKSGDYIRIKFKDPKNLKKIKRDLVLVGVE